MLYRILFLFLVANVAHAATGPDPSDPAPTINITAPLYVNGNTEVIQKSANPEYTAGRCANDSSYDYQITPIRIKSPGLPVRLDWVFYNATGNKATDSEAGAFNVCVGYDNDGAITDRPDIHSADPPNLDTSTGTDDDGAAAETIAVKYFLSPTSSTVVFTYRLVSNDDKLTCSIDTNNTANLGVQCSHVTDS